MVRRSSFDQACHLSRNEEPYVKRNTMDSIPLQADPFSFGDRFASIPEFLSISRRLFQSVERIDRDSLCNISAFYVQPYQRGDQRSASRL